MQRRGRGRLRGQGLALDTVPAVCTAGWNPSLRSSYGYFPLSRAPNPEKSLVLSTSPPSWLHDTLMPTLLLCFWQGSVAPGLLWTPRRAPHAQQMFSSHEYFCWCVPCPRSASLPLLFCLSGSLLPFVPICVAPPAVACSLHSAGRAGQYRQSPPPLWESGRVCQRYRPACLGNTGAQFCELCDGDGPPSCCRKTSGHADASLKS